MSAQPFETTFLQALRYLHAPDPDATRKLKALLDESLAQKKVIQPPSAPVSKPHPIVKPVVTNRPTPPPPATVTVPATILASSDDIDHTSLSCVVCRRADQTGSNEIIECQECHSLYHQDCHKPSLANENVKDPRFVWYCSTCTNKRKKAKLPSKPAPSSSGNGATSKDSKEGQQNPEVSPFKSWSFLQNK